jgi:phage protein U
MKTYASLGGVKFEIPAVEGINETLQWEYKEQETVADKIALQYGGAKAKTMDLKIKLMAKFCKPEEKKQQLEAEAKKIAPLPFILANGRLLGYFVISEITQSLLKTDKKGDIIAAEMTLKLIEANTEGGSGSSTIGGGGNALSNSKSIASANNLNIKKPILPVEVLRSNPLESIRSAVQQQQLKITGQIPTIDQALRRAVP